MRTSRFIRSIALSVISLAGVVCYAQSVPANRVPFISLLTPPSLQVPPPILQSGSFTLTISGANFPATPLVSLSANGGNQALYATSATVNATGTQIVAQFPNSALNSPTTYAVTVTNPGTAGPLAISNTVYLPVTLTAQSVALNQNTSTFLPGAPKGIVVGDFRNSGFLDFAVVSQNSNVVSLLASDLGGPFIPGASYATGNQPWGIAIGTFWGLQYADLAITNSADNTITILLANGDGTFRPGSTIALPGVFPTQVVAADFNADGKLDLAVVNACGTGAGGCFPQAAPQGPGTVTILLGNGDGTFAVSPEVLTVGNVPYAIATADFNADGFLDLVVANSSDNTLTLLMGNGDGTFTPATNLVATGNSPSGIAVGDFNGDGNLDLAITNSMDSTVSILLNQNCSSVAAVACTFAATPVSPATGANPSAVATGDLNADGFLDLVVTNATGNSVSVLLGDGTGAFHAVVPQGQLDFSTGALPQDVVLADFNKDGRLDIVTSNASGSFSYLRQAAVAQLTLSSNNPAPVYGLLVTFTANINPPFGQATPTGSVTFLDGTTAIGTVSLNGYQGNFQFAGLSTGAHQITAVYSGDSNFASVSSNAVAESVAQEQTTTTLTANVSSAPYGVPVTLTATIQPQYSIPGTATGTVTFFDTTTSTSLGNATPVSDAAQLTLSNLATGSHVIVALYNGDANFKSSTSATYTQTVTQASTTTTVSTNLTQAQFAQTVTFTATIQPAGSNSPTGTVGFYDGSTLLGSSSVASGSATFSTTVLTLGNHMVSAQYSGDSNFLSSSGTTSVIVTKSATSTTVSTNLTPSTYGQNVTFSAIVTPAFGSLPSGQVSFYDGTSLLGTANTTTGAAQITVPSLTGGTHAITAQWVPTYNYAASTSNAITQTVTPAASTTSISAVPNPSSYGQRVIFTVTVDSTYHYISNGGTVTLFDNGTAFTLENIQGGTAVFWISTLTAGVHSLTANYAGDSNLTGSSSTAYTQTINQATTTTSVVLSSYSTLYGQSVTVTASVASPSTLGETGTVSFFDGSTLLGTTPVSGARAQFTTSTWSPGTHTISAQYNGDANFVGSATTQSQTLTVSKDPTLTNVSVDINPSTYGQTVTLTAAVQLEYGSGATGSVTFLDGAAPIGTAAFANGGAKLAISTLSGGSHSITAQYSGDASFASSTSTAITETVNPAATSTTVTSVTNPANFGQAVTLTATVQPPAGTTASGSITFVDGSFGIGTATLTNNTGQLTVSFLAPGSHTITAVYGGNASLSGSTSAALTETIHQAATTVTVTSNLNPAPFGQCVQLSGTVQPPSGTTKATGTVTFFDGTVSLGSGTVANNAATLSNCAFQGGAHTITANYGGDTNYLASTSAALTETVNPVSSSITISSSQNPVAYGSTVTLTATVLPSISGGSATGSVTFFDGATSLGSATVSSNSAQLSVSPLLGGTHSITAKYSGDGNFTGSTSGALVETVNTASTTTTLASSVNPSSYGQSVTLTASVQTPLGGSATGTVTFLDGTTSLGTATIASNTAQVTVPNLAAGSHSITSKYSGDGNFSGSTSAVLTETVNQATATTGVVSNLNPATFGQSVIFTATVQANGTGTPTGTVTLMDGGTSIGSGSLSGGNAVQFTIGTLTGGSHSITAVYSGDANFSGSTSTGLGETVNPASTATTVATSANPVSVGQAVTFTATVQPSTGTTASGNVNFLDGTTVLGSVALASNTAQLTLSTLAPGSHSITAVYGGSANLAGSTSTALVETVNQAATTTTVTSSLNPAPYGQPVTFTVAIQPATSGNVTGTVNLLDGTTTIGVTTLVAGQHNSASFTLSGIQGGTHTITATYAGDANYTGSTSAALTQTITQGTTTITVASSVNPAALGQTVTLTATIAPSVTGSAVGGSVTFYDGTTALGTASPTSNVAQLSISSLAAGSHSISAKATGDANFSGSTSAGLTQTVNLGTTTTTIASSLDPSAFGQAVTFVASIQPPAGNSASGTVTFLDGSASIGTATVSSNSAQVTVSGLAPGSHSITASYGGNANLAGSTSGVLAQTVNKAVTSTAVSSSLNPSTYGQSVTFTATVQPASGSSPTGTVTFLDGTTQLGTGNLSGGSAQFTTAGTALIAGAHSITARYAGDANFAGSTSAVLMQTVNAAAGGTPTIDVRISADQGSAKSSVNTATFSTSAATELLLAFISTDASGGGSNAKVNSVSGGGLTWTLVLRSSTQRGTAEIWRAFSATTLSGASVTASLSEKVSSSMTVMSFTGIDTSGTGGSGAIGATKSANASSGAPTAQLVTTRNGSLVIGVGNDYDNAIARTVGSGQTLVHQYLSPVGDTYWVQMENAPTMLSGTTVVINDTAPTSDRYNLAICEILAAP